MCDGLLKVKLPNVVMLVEYIDYLEMVSVASLRSTDLTEHNTEVLLITTRKVGNDYVAS